MLQSNMLYIFGSNKNLEQTNLKKTEFDQKKQFFTPGKNITCIVILCIVILTLALSIWQKDKIFSFFKGKKSNKNSDSQNNDSKKDQQNDLQKIELSEKNGPSNENSDSGKNQQNDLQKIELSEKNDPLNENNDSGKNQQNYLQKIEIFEKDGPIYSKDSNGQYFQISNDLIESYPTIYIKDSNGQYFETNSNLIKFFREEKYYINSDCEYHIIDDLYYKKDQNKKVLYDELKATESYYYLLIKENNKNYLIKSNIKFDYQKIEESEMKKIEIIKKISQNINQENKIECKGSNDSKIFYFDNQKNNYRIIAVSIFNKSEFLAIKSNNLFILTEEENNKKYVERISLEDVTINRII